MPNDPGSIQQLKGGKFVGDSKNVGSAGFGISHDGVRSYGNVWKIRGKFFKGNFFFSF